MLSGNIVMSALETSIEMDHAAGVLFSLTKVLFFEWAVIWHAKVQPDTPQAVSRQDGFQFTISAAKEARGALHTAHEFIPTVTAVARAAQGVEYALAVADLFNVDRESDGFFVLRSFSAEFFEAILD